MNYVPHHSPPLNPGQSGASGDSEEGGPVLCSGDNCLGLSLGPAMSSSWALGKPTLVAQFSHLWNGQDNSSHPTRLWED